MSRQDDDDNNEKGKEPRIYLPEGEEPGPFDIICERGVTGTSHEGNKNFNKLIMDWKPLYSGYFHDVTDDEKKDIVLMIIEYIKRGREMPGRFLSRDKDSKRWFESPPSDGVEQKRVSQALRDAHSPQWAYLEKIAELRPIYQQMETEQAKAAMAHYVLVLLRGGRMNKGHFLHSKSVKARNLERGKRRFRTEKQEVPISDEVALDWIRADLEGPDAHGLNEGIKYVIDSCNRQFKIEGAKCRPKPPPYYMSTTSAFPSPDLSSGTKRTREPKKQKRIQTSSNDEKRAQQNVVKTMTSVRHPLHEKKVAARARTGTMQDTFLSPEGKTNNEAPNMQTPAAYLGNLREMLAARQQTPLSEIVLCKDTPMTREEQVVPRFLDRSKSDRLSMSSKNLDAIGMPPLEMDFALNDTPVMGKQRSRRNLRASRSFSAYGRTTDDDIAWQTGDPVLTPHTSPLRRKDSFNSARQRDFGFGNGGSSHAHAGVASSPSTQSATLSFGTLSFGKLSLMDQLDPPFVHELGSMALKGDSASMGTFTSFASSMHTNSVGTIGYSGSPSSSLCAPVSPGRVFQEESARLRRPTT